jgi:hypothetical protein
LGGGMGVPVKKIARRTRVSLRDKKGRWLEYATLPMEALI